MKIELLAKGNVEKVLNEMEISFSVPYVGEAYKVIEIEKNDVKSLSNMFAETSNAWWYYSKGARTGSACDFFRINGHDLIGWAGNARKDSYKTLLDYFTDEIGLVDDEGICDYAVSLAKVNGISLSKLFKIYEG